MDDGQTTKARSILNENKELFDQDSFARLQALIVANEGGDPRAEFESLYNHTKSLIDLQNLITYLGKIKDWLSLLPLLKELYRNERTLENARKLAACLQHCHSVARSDLLLFLNNNEDMVDRCDQLKSTKAWTLYLEGDLKQALEINNQLLQFRSNRADLILDINIAIQSGNWERFPAIIEREWPNREQHQPEFLMHLASLAAEADQAHRAIELAKLAVLKAGDDPAILINAYTLSVQLGKEDEVDPTWITRASAASTNEGPVWPIDIRTIIEEVIPTQREQVRRIEAELYAGRIPLHIAATALNLPLSQLLISTPRNNATLQDRRKQPIIPTFHGGRPRIDPQEDWTIGFDITSIMLLTYLDVLPKILSCFARIAIAPETMHVLINERRRVKFHQPSQIKEAEEIRTIINNKLNPADLVSNPPDWLIKEVGEDLAELLETALSTNGFVIRPYPIYRLTTFNEEEASLGEYEKLIVSTNAFVSILFDEGRIDSETFEKARAYLGAHDISSKTPPNLPLFRCALYLDDLAITYLKGAGLLEAAASCGLNLFFHPSIKMEYDSLIVANWEGDKLASTLNNVRKQLYEAINTGKVTSLRHHSINDDTSEIGIYSQSAPTLKYFIESVETCDAICVDDRYINRDTVFRDQNNHSVPLVCTLDMLQHLVARDIITIEEKDRALHKLRLGGFTLPPIDSSELLRRLRSARTNQTTSLTETAELRAIRHSIMRARSLNIFDNSEIIYLINLLRQSVLSIRQIWDDELISPEYAVALTEWVWHNVIALPIKRPTSEETFGQYLSFLFQPMPTVERTRYRYFTEWATKEIVEPLLPANGAIIDSAAERMISDFERLFKSKTSEALYRSLAESFCNSLPTQLRNRIFDSARFHEAFKFFPRTALTINESIDIDQNELFSAARKVLANTQEKLILNASTCDVLVEHQDGDITISFSSNENETILKLNELAALSAKKEERTRATERLLLQLGPTTPFSNLRQITESRSLTDDEMSDLLYEGSHGVTAIHKKIEYSLSQGSFFLDDIIPKSLSYYERFCGPLSGTLSPTDYILLANYRRQLIGVDAYEGIKICLLGSIVDNLAPGTWCDHLNDDELWNILNKCNPWLDPISLLGALDISLRRQQDVRYLEFSARAIEKLTQDSFIRPDGNDAYEVISVFADLTIDRINNLKNGVLCPPFWKRMCAWMHASMLARITFSVELDIERLREWSKANQTRSGFYTRMLDFRREPNWSAAAMSRRDLQQQILYRLRLTQRQFENSGSPLPNSGEIDTAVRKFDDYALSMNLPLGDFLGGGEEIDHARTELSHEDTNNLVEMLRNDVNGQVISLLAKFCRHFIFPSALSEEIVETITRMKFGNTQAAREMLFSRLSEACLISTSMRNENLASKIAVIAIEKASQFDSEIEAAYLMKVLLLASTAISDENNWSAWLEEQMTKATLKIPSGKLSKAFLDEIREVKKIIPLVMTIHARPEALLLLSE